MGILGDSRRFARGEAVWVCPSSSGEWLSDDEAVVLEDLGAGYLVLQASERVPSHGQGHFVCDTELTELFEKHRTPNMEPVVRSRRIWEFNERAMSVIRKHCPSGQEVRGVLVSH